VIATAGVGVVEVAATVIGTGIAAAAETAVARVRLTMSRADAVRNHRSPPRISTDRTMSRLKHRPTIYLASTLPNSQVNCRLSHRRMM